MTYGVILFYYDGKLEQYIVLADSEKDINGEVQVGMYTFFDKVFKKNFTLLSYLRFIKYYFRYYKTLGRFSLWMAFCNCSVYFRTHFHYLFVDFYFYKRLTN